MDTKVCSRKDCVRVGEQQPVENFYIRKRTGKPQPECKECSKRSVAKAQKSDRYRNYQREYRRNRLATDPEFKERTLEAGRKHDAKPSRKESHYQWWAAKANDPEFLLSRRILKRESMRRYRNSPEHKERQRQKHLSDRAAGKKQAREAVYWATKLGIIKKTGKCLTPDAKGRICWGKTTWHHFNGYEEENWLDVVELCERHHRMADNDNRALVSPLEG